MKGRSTTRQEQELHDELREHGCAVCRYVVKPLADELGVPAIHHIDGRTKPGAHKKVIPLCSIHHQHGVPGHPSIHANGSIGGKAQFYQAYRVTEMELLGMCELTLGYEYSRAS